MNLGAAGLTQGHRGNAAGTLYPPLDPYARGFLDVGEGHSLYWETSGNPVGKPVVFLHGGPGGGCNNDHRRLFDPQLYRIVLFDQRGCGRSRPVASLHANTTQHIIADIEQLRGMLGIDRWLVLGGSWGAMLAVLYAETHRDRVTGLVLRGMFSGRRREIEWLYKRGASEIFPEAWQKFIAPIPHAERGDLLGAYHRLITGDDRRVAVAAARSWCAWEAGVMTLLPRPGPFGSSDDNALALAGIEAHYFVNDCFVEEGQVLRDAGRLAGIPGIIVQGRYDVVTPATTSFDLHMAWSGSTLDIVPDAGHATSEPGIVRRLIAATDSFAR